MKAWIVLFPVLILGAFPIADVRAQCNSADANFQSNLHGQAPPHTYLFANLCPSASIVHVTLGVTADLGCHPNDATDCNSLTPCPGDLDCHCNAPPTSKYITLQIGPAGNTVLITASNTLQDTATQPCVQNRDWFPVPANGRFFEAWNIDSPVEKEFGRSPCQFSTICTTAGHPGEPGGIDANEHRFYIDKDVWNAHLSGGTMRFVVTITSVSNPLTEYCAGSLGGGNCSPDNGRPTRSQISFSYTCEAVVDCNTNGVPDECDADCNSNGTPDDCEAGYADCNSNGTLDACELAAHDCNSNGIVDECDTGLPDCNANATPDVCELAGNDCNANGIPDECDLAGNDCNGNGIPDECEPDCNSNGTPDACELGGHDCNTNGTLDPCEAGYADCNADGTADSCQLAGNDCNANAVPDECEDCNTNGLADECDTRYDGTFAGFLFWSEAGGSRVRRAPLDAPTNITTIHTGLNLPAGLAIDTDTELLYWTEWGSDKIRRSSLGGGTIDDLVTSNLIQPYSIQLDLAAGRMVWADASSGNSSNHTLRRRDISGGTVTTLWTMSSALPDGPYDVALDLAHNRMYWTHARDNRIYRSDLDANTNSIDSNFINTGSGSRPVGITLDLVHSRIYWTEYDAGSGDRIGSANLDGSGAGDLPPTGLSDPDHIAVDPYGGHIYWTEYAGNRIRRANLDGTGVVDFNTSGLSNPSGIAVIPAAGSADCNTNEVPDECELAADDCNASGVPDECDESCEGFAKGDVNCDGLVDGDDIQPFITVLIEAVGSAAQWCAADICNDGEVTADDVEPFVCLLLDPAAEPDDCCNSQFAFGGGESSGSQESQSNESQSQSAGQQPAGNPYAAQIMQWHRDHPYCDYPEMTVQEYFRWSLWEIYDLGYLAFVPPFPRP